MEKESKLEHKSKEGFLNKIKKILEYIDHYVVMDLTGYLMDKKPLHNHNLVSRDNYFVHSKIDFF